MDNSFEPARNHINGQHVNSSAQSSHQTPEADTKMRKVGDLVPQMICVLK